ncbi:MAG: putative metal-binding motif-containing protein [Deltaproteobacteria bacterium]|nr:putative metal-binding motif-containing protein [Deltaproteobacteria bacterium]
MRTKTTRWTLTALGLVAACSSNADSRFSKGTTTSGDDAGGGGASSTTSTDSSGTFDPIGSGGGSGNNCETTPSIDFDKDGFTGNNGDCNDCDANVNPAAVEVPTDPNDPKADPVDENCDGNVDEAAAACDMGLTLDDVTPMNGARAIGLCNEVKPGDKSWGVLQAAYTRSDGSPASPGLSVGLLPKFGSMVKPRAGASMLGLSSGRARDASMTGNCASNSCQTLGVGTAPAGFPQDVPACPGDTEVNDDIALSLKVKAPSNATGYSFEFNFYSFEYPEFVCTLFNDQFIALVNPPPAGSVNGNISFDSMKNPVSVNIAFFQVCADAGCSLGDSELLGTGFDTWDDAGATSWLTTQAPVKGGETFDIRFAIWDTGDQSWDSTVLVDNFTWVATPGVAVTTVPTPK